MSSANDRFRPSPRHVFELNLCFIPARQFPPRASSFAAKKSPSPPLPATLSTSSAIPEILLTRVPQAAMLPSPTLLSPLLPCLFATLPLRSAPLRKHWHIASLRDIHQARCTIRHVTASALRSLICSLLSRCFLNLFPVLTLVVSPAVCSLEP